MKIRSIYITLFFAIFMFSCSDSVDSDGDNGNGNGQPTADPELVYFWFFDVTIMNDTELETIDATFSAGANNALIEYRSSMSGYPDTERMASMERRNRPTAINYRPGGNQNQTFEEVADSMRAIQVREPFLGNAGQNMLIFHLPTTGFENPVFSFAAMDEGAANGLRLDYSVADDDDEDWITTGLSSDEIEQSLLTGEYLPYEVNFSGIGAANDNPDFKIRVRFDVDDGTQNEDNRVTFNNVALDAESIE